MKNLKEQLVAESFNYDLVSKLKNVNNNTEITNYVNEFIKSLENNLLRNDFVTVLTNLIDICTEEKNKIYHKR